MKKYLLIPLLGSILLHSCLPEFIPAENTPLPVVQTLGVDTTNLIVEGEAIASGNLNRIGDGITQYGHVWGSTDQVLPQTVSDLESSFQGQFTAFKDAGSPITYESLIPNLAENTTYTIRAYAIDRYGEIYLDRDSALEVRRDNRSLDADFSVTRLKDPCFAPCRVEFRDSTTTVNISEYQTTWFIDDVQVEGNVSEFSFLFGGPGEYTVKLEVNTPGLPTDIKVVPVSVPTATFVTTIPEVSRAYDAIENPQIENGLSSYWVMGHNNSSGSEGKLKILRFDERSIQNSNDDIEISGMMDFELFEDPFELVSFPGGDLAVLGTMGRVNPIDRALGYGFAQNNGTNYTTTVDELGFITFNEFAADLLKTSDQNAFVLGTLQNRSTFVRSIFYQKKTPYPAPFTSVFIDTISLDNSLIATSAIELEDGSFMIAGTEVDDQFKRKPVLFIVSESGIWSGGSIYLNTGSETGNITPISLTQLSDGSLIVVGNVVDLQSFDSDIMIWRINQDGSPIWTSPSLISSSEFETVNEVESLEDGSFALVGSKGTEGALFFFDVNGALQHTHEYGTVLYSISKTRDGGFLLSGISGNQGFLVKTNSSGTLTP